MKNFLSLMAIATALVFTSCNDEGTEELNKSGKNTVSVVFETSFNGEMLKTSDLGKKEFTFNGDKLKISAFDFIVGNFILVDENNKEFVYPKEDSFFIVSKGGEKVNKKTKEKVTLDEIESIELKNVPAGKYKSIKFGIGVDEATYTAGDQFANKLWERAEKYHLTWSWATGYKFSVLEGMVATTPFKYHVASAANDNKYVATKDMYREVTIDLSNTPFLVATDKAPQIHLLVDASKMLTNVKVSDTPVLMGPKANKIADDSKKMFSFEHTHYNGEKH